MGERYASENGLNLERFPADWSAHHKGAGSVRNREMVHRADAVIVFWDGKSAGTKNIIECARAEKRPCTVIRV